MTTQRISMEGSIRLPFEYAAGKIAGAALEAERREGRLLASRCQPCGRVVSPARPLCPTCGSTVEDLVEVGPGGTVESWTSVPGGRTFLLVQTDGSDTAMLALQAGEPRATPRIGGRARAVFNDDGLAGFEVID